MSQAYNWFFGKKPVRPQKLASQCQDLLGKLVSNVKNRAQCRVSVNALTALQAAATQAAANEDGSGDNEGDGNSSSERGPRLSIAEMDENKEKLAKNQANAAELKKEYDKLSVEFENCMLAMKVVLYGDLAAEVEGKKDKKYKAASPDDVKELADALCEDNLIINLIHTLRWLPFEARKHLANIYCHLCYSDTKGKPMGSSSAAKDGGGKSKKGGAYEACPGFIKYLRANKAKILEHLTTGLQHKDAQVQCAKMLSQMAQHPILAQDMLESPNLVFNFLSEHVLNPNFDICKEAFDILSLLLVEARGGSKWLTANEEKFLTMYDPLLIAGWTEDDMPIFQESYLVRRLALKLLGEILLEPVNQAFMMKYISNRENLVKTMYMLAIDNPRLQYEAFHILKIFIANPSKTKQIEEALADNTHKLIPFLQKFDAPTLSDNEVFTEEKKLIIGKLQDLKLDREKKAKAEEASTTE
eukprot:g2289.t1